MTTQSFYNDLLWQAVLTRDRAFDGVFFYGVRSTKIYCRSTCPSRKPNRDQVSFFDSPQTAELAGYRPCKRCQPQIEISSIAAKILAICRYLESQTERIPTLTELGSIVGISPTHLQRSFKQLVGVTPFQYADAHRIQRFKQHLQQGETIVDALYETGYGASSRLYEKAPQQLGMTPATYQSNGQGETIRYVIVSSPLGHLLVAATTRGLCSVRLGESAIVLEQEFKQEFSKAELQPSDRELQHWSEAIVDYLSAIGPCPDLPLDIQATAFQLQVWQALQKIPYGQTRSYSEIACLINQPKAVRAVARACATNPVALVIPCHRVVQKNGNLSGYRWGIDRKQALLDLERRNKPKAT